MMMIMMARALACAATAVSFGRAPLGGPFQGRRPSGLRRAQSCAESYALSGSLLA